MRKAPPRMRQLGIEEIGIARDARYAMTAELDGIDADAEYPGWRDRFSAFYASKIDDGLAAIFAAEADGTTVGVACVYLLKNHRSDILARQSAYVSNVWVEPAHRRQGLASALTRLCIGWANDKGCEVVRLRSSKMARPVYASLGFEPSEEMELRLKPSGL